MCTCIDDKPAHEARAAMVRQGVSSDIKKCMSDAGWSCKFSMNISWGVYHMSDEVLKTKLGRGFNVEKCSYHKGKVPRYLLEAFRSNFDALRIGVITYSTSTRVIRGSFSISFFSSFSSSFSSSSIRVG